MKMLLPVILLCCISCTLRQNVTIEGKVYDDADANQELNLPTDTPLGEVQVASGSFITTNDNNGSFLIEAYTVDSSKAVTLYFSKSNYNTATVTISSFEEKAEGLVPKENNITVLMQQQ